MSKGRIPLSIPIQPWFQDHCFGGKVILAGVETLLLLAAKVEEIHPEVNICIMEDVRFAKFLEIPPGAEEVTALIECEVRPGGRIQATLLSRIQFKAMSRIKEHGAISFHPSHTRIDSSPELTSDPLPDYVTEISVEDLYRELVPFGPSYQTLQDTLYLSENAAWGVVRAPGYPFVDSVQENLGSPFPLDGALHAACVLGQQDVDFVPFPVGFKRRSIVRATQPGASYVTKVILLSQTDEELVFDLGIFNNQGDVYEIVNGVSMRDVSNAVRG